MTSKSRTGRATSVPADVERSDRSDCEQHREELLDDALDDSFPASDPPSLTRPPAKDC